MGDNILSLFNFNTSIHVIAILLTIFLVVLRRRALKRPSKESTSLPPGPWKLPIIGNLHQMVGNGQQPHRRLMSLAQKHGPLMHLQLGETPNVIVSSREHAREILKTHDLIFAFRPINPIVRILSYGARSVSFAPLGDHWRLMRKICALELLSSKRVDSLRPLMEDEIAKLITSIRQQPPGGVINVTRMLISVGNAIMSRAAFTKVQKQEEAFLPVMQDILRAYGGFDLGYCFPSNKLVRLLSGAERRAQKIHDEADVILESIIADHVARRAARSSSAKLANRREEEEEEEEEDIVDVLLNFRDNQGLGLPEVKAVVLDMFLGGGDTFSANSEWAMSELMRNPRIMERAQKEVRRTFDGKGRRSTTAASSTDHEEELNYVELVMKETMRLHPSAPLLGPRECQETVVVGGFRIPKNTKVLINAFAIGREPRYWPDPDEFNPERFVDHNPISGTDFEFIPFGGGRRICPGMQFGTTLIELLLANLLYHFDWQLPDGMDPRDLDMSERFGIVVRRKIDLLLVPIPYNPTKN